MLLLFRPILHDATNQGEGLEAVSNIIQRLGNVLNL